MTTRRTDASPPGADSLSVAAAAALVGVAPSTLRTWARRYGLEPSGHRTGVHRRYSEADVARLQLMRSLTRSGMSSRDAAERARAAGPRDLALAAFTGACVPAATSLGHGGQVGTVGQSGPGLPGPAVARGGPGAPGAGPARVAALDEVGARRPTAAGPLGASGADAVEGLDPAVRALLATLGRGDARGATALLRLAVRELGAARTYDERVLPARRAGWLLPGGARERSVRLLALAAAGAVGEVELRRQPRNDAAVVVASLPPDEGSEALPLARAALGERSLASVVVHLPPSEDGALRRLAAAAAGRPLVVALHVGREPAQAALAARLRAHEGADVVLWGPGWVHWPGQPGSLADLVRAIESLAARDA